MERSKKSFRLILPLFLFIPILLALALSLGFPAFAETTSNTIEIDGVLYDQIDITSEQLAALVNGGSVGSQWHFSTTSYSGYTFGDLFNLENHTKGQFHVSSNFPYDIPKNKLFALVNGDDVFIGLPYVYRANRIYSEDLTADFGLAIPFDAYFYNTSISYSYSSVYTVTTSTFIARYDGQTTYSNSSSLNTLSPTPYWNTIPLFVDFYNKYNWSFDGYTLSNLRTAFFTNTIGTGSELKRFSFFTIQNVTNVPMQAGSYSPVGFIIHGPLSVLVEHDEATVIEEYLGLITGRPNASQRMRIQELEDQFQADRDNMQNIVDDLHVDMPDNIPSVSSLPSQATQGISKVSSDIWTPLLDNPFLQVLVTSLFILTAIKLVLYGSGDS